MGDSTNISEIHPGDDPVVTKRVGDYLKAARLDKNLTLEAVAQATKIRLSYLEALETNNWLEFPAEVYLMGFLKKYAQFLGLSPQEMVELCKQQKDETLPEKPTEWKSQAATQDLEPSFSPVHALGVWIGILTFLAMVLLYIYHHKSNFVPSPDVPVEHLRFISPSTENSLSKNPSQEHVLSVTALKDTWLTVSSGERRIFEGTIQAASIRTWKSPGAFYLSARRTAHIRVEIDGSPVDLGDADGREIRLPQEPKSPKATQQISEKLGESPR